MVLQETVDVSVRQSFESNFADLIARKGCQLVEHCFFEYAACGQHKFDLPGKLGIH
jgi:hypothetical protein